MKNFEIKHDSTNEKTFKFYWKCFDNEINALVEGFVDVEIDEVESAHAEDNFIIIDDFVKSKLDVAQIEAELDQKIADQLK